LKIIEFDRRSASRAKEAEEQDKAYRFCLKSQGKQEKPWAESDERERKEYRKAQKNAAKQGL
jgi:hypothetical protein